MKCSECRHYDKEEKICLVDSWNDVSNPERNILCDSAEKDEEIKCPSCGASLTCPNKCYPKLHTCKPKEQKESY